MTAAFRLENIERRFGKVQALDGLSITIQQGEVYGFLGRNGAAKPLLCVCLWASFVPTTDWSSSSASG
jgi:ABC-type multidrug transport system ATPase subunit